MKKQLIKIAGLTSQQRVELFRPRENDNSKTLLKKWQFWKMYYMSDKFFFNDSPAQIQEDRMKVRVFQNKSCPYLCVAHGNSGKSTSWIAYLTYLILYDKAKFVVYQSSISYSVSSFIPKIVDVLTSENIKRDYGKLVKQSFQETERQEKQRGQSVKRFVLENDTLLLSQGIGTSIRGVLSHFTNQKPDWIVMDDIVNSDIARSDTKKEIIRQRFLEAVRSKELGGRIISLSNMTLGGNLAQEQISSNEKIDYMIIPATEQASYRIDNKVTKLKKQNTNNNRFVLTELEAHEINKTRTAIHKVSSIDKLKGEMGENWAFEGECNLFSSQNRLFKDYKNKNAKETIINRGGFEIKRYEVKDFDSCYLGCDPALGTGNDNSAIVVLTENKEVVMTFNSNQINTSQLCSIIEFMYNYFAEDNKSCTVAIERNSFGQIIINDLVQNNEISDREMFKEVSIDKITNQETNRLGWLASNSSITKGFIQLQNCYDELILNDKDVISQTNKITWDDINNSTRISGHHWDILRALLISNWSLYICDSNKVLYDI